MAQYTQSVQEELHSGSNVFTDQFNAVTTGTEIITTPGYHKSIFISDIIVSNGATAGYIRFDDTPGFYEFIQRINLAIDGIFVANFSEPLRVTPNMGLRLSATTADDFSVTINYYIDEVKGFGYTSGGYASAVNATIDENYYASDSNSTDVGDLTAGRYFVAGQSSSVSGYTSGGHSGTGASNIVDKVSFSSGGDGTLVGYLTVERYGVSGQSSPVSGYTSGGNDGGTSEVVDKFSYSSDSNATDVGDLTVARYAEAGQQSN